MFKHRVRKQASKDVSNNLIFTIAVFWLLVNLCNFED